MVFGLKLEMLKKKVEQVFQKIEKKYKEMETRRLKIIKLDY